MNRFQSYCLLLLLTVSVLPIVSTAQTVEMELNQGWRFRSSRSENMLPATVPGVVHTDLIDNCLIDDPFVGMNERKVQWVDKEDWIYQTTFDLPDSMSRKRNYRLTFEGLDTYADVYLNGELILKADNMFRRWIADVSSLIADSGNELKIYFHSPLKIDLPKWDSLPYHYQAGNDQSQAGGLFDKKVSIFARKAGYHYGWDWGPRLVTSGIWRKVVLTGWDAALIDNIQIVQHEVTDRIATVTESVEIVADRPIENAELVVRDSLTNRIYARRECRLDKGSNKVDIDFQIRNPRLWWCNGLGEPNMYGFVTELRCGSQSIDSRTEQTGLRSIRLVRDNDQYGTSFFFVLNGVRVFVKGANHIPNDNFLPRVSDEVYRREIADAVAVNMNMLRVWGGGVYEDDRFYELCDRNGIMVWQDFMFACSLYPAEGAMLENIEMEAVDNVKRLRNHPSVVLWCGNNENQVAWFGWGWKEEYERQNQEWGKLIWSQYCAQYFEVLPKVVEQYGSGTAYTPSSPFSTKDKGQNGEQGDRHFWGVWHSKLPVSTYNTTRARFFSEYGFQSFPEMKTIEQFAPDSLDWSIGSDVMMSHQRGGAKANALIEDYLLREYRTPKDFESFVYMSQILQADAVKTAIEAHRRDKPYCMGTLFWQINDCWPVASWSSIDCYGRWKAQHYITRRAYDDVLISGVENDRGTMSIYVVSDRLKPFNASLQLTLYKLSGEVIASRETKTVVAADSSTEVMRVAIDEILNGAERNDVLFALQLTDRKTGRKYENNWFATIQKEMNYLPVEIEHTVTNTPEGVSVELCCDRFARAVRLSVAEGEAKYSDNCFDLLPNRSVRIDVKTEMGAAEFEKQLHIMSLVNAYEQ